MKKDGSRLLKIFLSQLSSLLFIVLLIAGFVSLFTGEVTDAISIFGILAITVIFGFVQEYRADRALQYLKRLERQLTMVVREGALKRIDSRELVVGDIVLLNAGDKVTADIRIIESNDLTVDQSVITGESLGVEKNASLCAKETSVLKWHNMVLSGSLVLKGRGKGIVVQTGIDTEVGKIAKGVEDIGITKTHLQKQLDRLSHVVLLTGFGGILLVCILGTVRGMEIKDIVLLGVSLAVSSIPEALPIVLTVALAVGVFRMAKKNALVRKLTAVEALGSVDVVCVDKTGTITENKMKVSKIVTGSGLLGKKNTRSKGELKMLKTIAMLCSESTFEIGGRTEKALNRYFARGGSHLSRFREKYKEVDRIAFDNDNRYMATMNVYGGEKYIFVKGSFHKVLNMCTKIYVNGVNKNLTKNIRKEIISQNLQLAQRSLRILGFAFKKKKKYYGKNKNIGERLSEKDLDTLTFVGMIGLYDPPRKGVKAAIKKCEELGVRVIMLTGDQKATAKAIAEDVGLVKSKSIRQRRTCLWRESEKGRVVDGYRIDGLSDKELVEVVKEVDVYSEVLPHQKLQILKALQRSGCRVAMTGDGVNDAPSLQGAEVGVAMISGSDVTRETAGIILLDDNFATIPKAIEEGRQIFSNVKKFVTLFLTVNFDEVFVIGISMLLKFPLPFLPIHILWHNVSDSLPAIALATDVKTENQKSPPRGNLLMGILPFTIIGGLLEGAADLIVFSFAFLFLKVSLQKAQTMTITSTLIFELFLIFLVRSRKFSIKQVFSNIWLLISVLGALALQALAIYTEVGQRFLRMSPLSVTEWGVIVLVTFVGVVILGGVRRIVRD